LRDHVVAPAPAQGAALPVLVGGNGDRLLAFAAGHADIVSFTGFSPDREGANVRSHFSRAGLADRVAHVRTHAAGRTTAPELNLLLQSLTITDDREYLAQQIAQRHNESIVEVLSCPFLALGTVEEIGAHLLRLAGDFGIGYVTVFNQYADDTAAVMAAFADIDT
jgi:alkanesulfonate monooxygenase SsuD/methylene tetrahydromethanopterin reductase-like flavin-dependent oxidoreductase (luciferase family)